MSQIKDYERDQALLACNQSNNGTVVVQIEFLDRLGATELVNTAILDNYKRSPEPSRTASVDVQKLRKALEGKAESPKPKAKAKDEPEAAAK